MSDSKKEAKRVYDLFIPNFDSMLESYIKEDNMSVDEALLTVADMMMYVRDGIVHASRELEGANVTLENVESFSRFIPGDEAATGVLEMLAAIKNNPVEAHEIEEGSCQGCGNPLHEKETDATVYEFPKLNAVPNDTPSDKN